MIQTAADGGIRTVTIDRPDRRNALTTEGRESLAGDVERATEPVLLRGASKAFRAGADLAEVGDLDRQRAQPFAELGQQVAGTLAGYDGATVAGIDGPARGGGVEFALACDLRVATPAATLAEPGVELGLFGAWGGTYWLPAVVGRGEAMDLALSGSVLDAREALPMGLVSRVVEEPRAVAEEITSKDPAAVRALACRLRDSGSIEARGNREVEAFADLIAEIERE